MSEPEYYTMGGLSPLKAFEQGLLTKEEYKGFLKGNIIKYVIRAGKKEDALRDIVKAMDYLHHLYVCFNEEDKRNQDLLLKDIQFEDDLEKVEDMIKSCKEEFLNG